MTPDPHFGFEQAATELIRGIVDAVADLPGLTLEQRYIKQQTTVFSVMAFQPRDPVEVMLAGHCVMYDHMLRDGTRDLLHGQAEKIKLRTRPGNLATGKIFLGTLDTLLRMQQRDVDKILPLPKADRAATQSQTVPEPRAATTPPSAASPAPSPPAKPRFGMERAHLPRRPQHANIARFEAALPPPGPEQPAPSNLDEPSRRRTYRSQLLGTVAGLPLSDCHKISVGVRVEPAHDPECVIGTAGVRIPEGSGTVSTHALPQTELQVPRITPAIQPVPIGES